jgi:hypothetical protein
VVVLKVGRLRAGRSSVAALFLTGLTGCSSGADSVYTVIDDMEGPSGTIEWTPPTGSPGTWSSFTAGGQQSDALLPLPAIAGGTWSYDEVPSPYQTRPGITSAHAAHLRTTTPLVNEIAAGMGFDFAHLPASTGNLEASALGVDLTAFSGISFWGMAFGPGTTRVSVWVDDASTHPSGGRCDPAATDNPRTACYNSFSFTVDLTGTFTHHTVDFSRLKQAAFGYQTMPSVLTKDKIYGMSFGVRTPGGFCPPSASCAGEPPTLTFDIWIDDLYFVGK